MAHIPSFSSFTPLPIELSQKTGSTFALIGASKRGKSTALVWLWKRYFAKTRITILCSPNYQQPVYKPFYNKCIVTPNIETCENIIRLMARIQQLTGNKYRFLVILDDVVIHKGSPVLRALILTLRNSNISTILSLQGMTLIDKNNRTSVNYCLMFGFNSLEGCLPLIHMMIPERYEAYKSGISKGLAYNEDTSNYSFIMKDMINGNHVVTRLPKELVTT